MVRNIEKAVTDQLKAILVSDFSAAMKSGNNISKDV